LTEQVVQGSFEYRGNSPHRLTSDISGENQNIQDESQNLPVKTQDMSFERRWANGTDCPGKTSEIGVHPKFPVTSPECPVKYLESSVIFWSDRCSVQKKSWNSYGVVFPV